MVYHIRLGCQPVSLCHGITRWSQSTNCWPWALPIWAAPFAVLCLHSRSAHQTSLWSSGATPNACFEILIYNRNRLTKDRLRALGEAYSVCISHGQWCYQLRIGLSRNLVGMTACDEDAVWRRCCRCIMWTQYNQISMWLSHSYPCAQEFNLHLREVLEHVRTCHTESGPFTANTMQCRTDQSIQSGKSCI